MAHILLVDDNPAVLGRMAEPLLALGHAVFAASDPAEAEAVLREEPLDLVFLSLHLDGGRGLELLERIKTQNHAVEVAARRRASRAAFAH